jgi:hypothetical protein
MRGVSRWLVRVCVAMSLVMFAATVVLWVRSYWVRDTIRRFEKWSVVDADGSLYLHNRLKALESSEGRWSAQVWRDAQPSHDSPADAAKLTMSWTEVWHDSVEFPSRAPPLIGQQSRWNRRGFFAEHHYGTLHDGEPVPPSSPWTQSIGRRLIGTPYWFPAALFALPPTVWVLVRLRRRGKKGRGFCAKCGYDLRATPERCPECAVAAN